MPFPAAPFLSAVSFSSALFLSLLTFPRMGIFVAMFAGVPVVLAQLRYPALLLGTGAMVTSGGLVFLLASLLKNPMPGLSVLLYVGLCGLPALVVAAALQRGTKSLWIILLAATQILVFLGGVGFLLYERTSGELWTAVSKAVHQAVLLVMNTAIQNAQSTLTPDDKTRLLALEPMIYKTFLALIPGLFASLGLLTAMVLWGTTTALREKTGEVVRGTGPETFLLPDPLVFGFIASLALLLVPSLDVRIFGTNLLMLLGTLYSGQGVAILVNYIRKRGFGLWFWFVAGFFILLQPLFLAIFALVGILDVWVDFRGVRGSTGGGKNDSGRRVDNGGNPKDVSGPTNDSHRDALSFGLLCLGDREAHFLGTCGRRFRQYCSIWIPGHGCSSRGAGLDSGWPGLLVWSDLLRKENGQRRYLP